MKLYLYLNTSDSAVALHLDGASVVAPITGTFYSPNQGPVSEEDNQEVIEETLKVRCAGTRDQVLAVMDTLSEMIDYMNSPLSSFDRLELRVEYETGNTWASIIKALRVIDSPLGIAAREFGVDIVTLVVKRLNYWEETSGESLELTNRSGTRQLTVTLYNHTDAGTAHDNYFDVLGTDVGGDLPAPISLDLAHLDAGRTVGQVWIAQANSTVALPAWVPLFELESAAAGAGWTLTSTADAGSSAGYFARLTGTAGAEALLLAVSLSAYQMSWFKGGVYKPLIRLANNHAYTDLWLKSKVVYGTGNSVAYDSGWVKCEANTPVIELGALKLPPYPANSNLHDTMSVGIYALKTNSAAVTLDMDFLQLSPTDGFNRLDMLDPVASGYHILEGEKCGSYRWSHATTLALPSHVRVGGSLQVTPGMNARFFVLHRSGSGMLIDTKFTASITFHKRKKVI